MRIIKDQLKKSPALRWLLLHKRASSQEKQYLKLCHEACRNNSVAFGVMGDQDSAKEILLQGWQGPQEVKKSRKDVHLFLIDRPGMGSPWMEEELARSFHVSVFSITRHKIAFSNGNDDLIPYSSGIDPADRLRKSFFPADFSAWHDRVQKDILSAIDHRHRANSIDLCFAYGTPREFDVETLKSIRKMGIPVALWYLDEKHGFLKRQAPLIGAYDLHLSNSFEPIRWYMARGQASYYFPQAADPDVYYPRHSERDIDVSFIGAAYGWRLDFIKALQRAGIPIESFGPGWPNGVVNDIVEIFCRSKINLGFGFTGQSERLTCIKERDFQVPATKSLYLTTFDPELTRHFNIGQEILCYRDVYDCVELIRYFLERTHEAERIAEAGYERSLRDHTWTKRMSDFLQWMGILDPSI